MMTGSKQMTDGTNIRVEFRTKGQVRRLPEIIEENLLRIAQEALTNVIKHSSAGQVKIELEFGVERVALQIKDDGQGFSPLTQITRDNVKDLRMAWSWTMRDGSNEATPLVHDGVMYLVNPQNVVQAIDARNGELIWEYANTYPPESMTLGGTTRNLAIYQDRIFLSTSLRIRTSSKNRALIS